MPNAVLPNLIACMDRVLPVTRFALFFCVTIFWLLATSICHSATPLEELQSEITSSVSQILEKDPASNAAVALVGPNGFVWTQGFGFIDKAHRQPVDADTLFSIQSTSKVFTAVAVLHAVEKGHLDLDKPVRTWLPDFTVRSRFDGQSADQITLRHLLSHRAGFTHEAPIGNNFSKDRPTFNEHLASISETWLRYPVGKQYAYSNLGIDVAGWVLQEQAKQPFEQVMHEQVLQPLGMTRSRYATSDLRVEPNRAVARIAGEELPPEIPILPSGGLYSSANDLVHFLRFNLDRGKPLLNRKSWETMHDIVEPVSSFQSVGYGLGVELENVNNSMLIANHAGGGFGFGSDVVWIPELGMGFAALKTANSSGDILSEVKRLFMNKVRLMAGPNAFAPASTLTSPIECLDNDDTRLPRGIWVGRRSSIMTILNNDKYGVYRTVFREICSVEGGLLARPTRGLRDSYRIDLRTDGKPDRFVGLHSGNVYDYNDGPSDPPGPNLRRWRSLLGTYEYSWNGLVPQRMILRIRNGYLYFDDLRLNEVWPQLFVASNGEVLDLRSEAPTWRSVRIYKIANPPTEDARNEAIDQAMRLYTLLHEGRIEEFLSHCTPPLKTVLENSLDFLHEQRGASEPISAEVDSLGAITRVLLITPEKAGAYRVDMYLDEDNNVVYLYFSNAAPRTWWHVAGAKEIK